MQRKYGVLQYLERLIIAWVADSAQMSYC